MKTKQNSGVFAAIRSAAAARPLLTAGTLLCVAASVGASLLPPLLLGRVMSGAGGELMIEECERVLRDEYSTLADIIHLALPDEKFRRVGQSAAAASLPENRK